MPGPRSKLTPEHKAKRQAKADRRKAAAAQRRADEQEAAKRAAAEQEALARQRKAEEEARIKAAKDAWQARVAAATQALAEARPLDQAKFLALQQAHGRSVLLQAMTSFDWDAIDPGAGDHVEPPAPAPTEPRLRVHARPRNGLHLAMLLPALVATVGGGD